MTRFQKDSHCTYCGHPFVPAQPWPRRCAYCHNVSFANPVPVTVMLVPVDEGLLLVRRGIEPGREKLALPGGYINRGESWQEAGVREVSEEAGLVLKPDQIQEFRVRSTLDGSILIFGLVPPLAGADLPPFEPSREATERLVVSRPVELAFPLHTEGMEAYFGHKMAGS